MTKRQTRMFFVGGTTLFALIFIALTIDSHTTVRPADARGGAHAAGRRRQARLAPQGLHQLPHAARRGRLLRARPDEDHAAARRGVPAPVPEGPVAVLLGRAARPADAEPEPVGPGDRRASSRFSRGSRNIDNNNWPPRPIRRERGDAAGHRARRAAPGRRLERSGRARRGAVPADAARRASAATRRSRACSSSGRRWRASARAPATRHQEPRLHRARRKSPEDYIRESIVQPERLRRARPDVLGRRASRSCRRSTATC